MVCLNHWKIIEWEAGLPLEGLSGLRKSWPCAPCVGTIPQVKVKVLVAEKANCLWLECCLAHSTASFNEIPGYSRMVDALSWCRVTKTSSYSLPTKLKLQMRTEILLRSKPPTLSRCLRPLPSPTNFIRHDDKMRQMSLLVWELNWLSKTSANLWRIWESLASVTYLQSLKRNSKCKMWPVWAFCFWIWSLRP